MASLRRFRVASYSPEEEDWDELGSVLLPPFAPTYQLEHALAVVGLFAPRGADVVRWCGAHVCLIYDALGTPMVELSTSP